MVRKCGYLPLAISVIGGVLSKKETLEEWKMVNKDIDAYLSYDEGMEGNYGVMQILTLSYEDLPYQLKPCLLHLAYYLDDSEIDVHLLYWMWIAQGMVLSKDRKGDETLMGVAERYLNELASRSLVQVGKDEASLIRSSYGTFRVHDLTRDLCTRKCKEEDFLEVLDFQGRKQSMCDLNSHKGNAYRLVVYGEVDDNVGYNIIQEANESTRLYSLRYLGLNRILAPKYLGKNLSRLRFLKVVTFQGLEFSNPKLLDKVIKELIHIRCLIFDDCVLDEVPSLVASLPYLQTFYLRVFCEVKIPNVFWKLKRLIHLFLVDIGSGTERKLRLDCLSGLETLFYTSSYSVPVEILPNLTNLRCFGSSAKDNESLSLIMNCIEVNWHKVREVMLRILPHCDFISTAEGSILLHKLFICRALKKLIIQVRTMELPKYESSMLALSNLVLLCLENCSIEEDPMPMLEKLPKLKILWLWLDSFMGEELICRSNGFPNLRYLELEELPNLKKWRIDERAMPNLSNVSVCHCSKLEMIPNGMRFLKALRELETGGMTKEFNNRIRVINGQEGADFHKVCHVPVISIGE